MVRPHTQEFCRRNLKLPPVAPGKRLNSLRSIPDFPNRKRRSRDLAGAHGKPCRSTFQVEKGFSGIRCEFPVLVWTALDVVPKKRTQVAA